MIKWAQWERYIQITTIEEIYYLVYYAHKNELIIFNNPQSESDHASLMFNSRLRKNNINSNKNAQPTRESSQEEIYEVETILNKKIKNGVEYYFVSWKGYPRNQATWEPITNMGNCSALILQYQLKNLSNTDKKQLSKALESEDEFKHETYQSSPCNIFEHNLQVIGGNVTLLQNYNKRLSFLQNIRNEKLPENAEITQIVNPQLSEDIETPTHFFVKIKDSSINRVYKVQKQTMIKYHRLKLIEYYQSLIKWNK